MVVKEITSNEVYQKELREERKLNDWNKQLGYNLKDSEDFLNGLVSNIGCLNDF